MTNRLHALTSIGEWEAALAASATRPILVYKHSTTCGTSAVAAEEVADLLAGPALPVDVFLVRIQEARPVSNAIAATLGVRHESPQVLLITDGTVLWHASHFRVTAASVTEALGRLLPQAASAGPPR